jgi:uncharacterized membrane protein YcjF (UPF0283 family)
MSGGGRRRCLVLLGQHSGDVGSADGSDQNDRIWDIELVYLPSIKGETVTRNERMKIAAGALLVIVGLAVALLSKEWIEETFGFEPDGGNGLLELALSLVPIAIGVWLLLNVALARIRRREIQRSGGS